MKVYIVSLKSEVGRRIEVERTLKRMQLPFEFVDAVDLRNEDVDTVNNKVSNFTLSGICKSKRTLTKGEIGCSLSHLKVYERFLSTKDRSAVIIEDDAIFESDFKSQILEINKEISSNSIWILGYSKLLKSDSSMFYRFEPISRSVLLENRVVGRPIKQWTCGTVGYVIERNAAQKILNQKKLSLADDWDLIQSYNISVLHVRPLLIYENFTNFESAISIDREKLRKKYNKKLNFLRYLRGVCRNIILKFY